MNREQARRRLEQTSNFTFVGGRVVITDRRTLDLVAELRAAAPTSYAQRPAPAPTTPAATQTHA